MLALDTEDDGNGNVGIINFFNGVEHFTFTGLNLRYDAWEWLNKQGPEKVWACNMEYDLINLYGFEWLGKLVTMQYVAAGFMRGFAKEAKITFMDTVRHWPMTVKQMGNYIGLPKLEADFTSIPYCQRDTEIVWRFVEVMLDRYDMLGLSLRATLPAMALQLFKKFYGSEFPQFPRSITDSFQKGYYGGRVEVYRYGKVEGPIEHYDVNSLFPSVMLENSFPDLSSWYHSVDPDFSKEGMFTGWIEIPENYYPCLPVREETEIIYPYGSVFGTWTYPEIRQLLKDGGRVQPKECIEFDRTEKPFTDYVNFCYEKRSKSESKTLDNVFWKLMLNSLYGKFAQSTGITTIYYDRKKRAVIEKDIDSRSAQSNVIWSAYVTSYARLKLLSFLRACSKSFYTDTDSLFTPDFLPTGEELGELKKEGSYREAEFKGNKLYIVDNKARAKGVPQSVAMDFIRTGRAVFRKPARFRESRRSFTKANVWYNVEKRLEKTYTKRKILNSGETVPWHYAEYKRQES